MSSILPRYEYDIFISYRQKDNKGRHWVTDFVDALKTELEATFKEDISIYFDENPYDGLLESHDVDKSLEGKLRCLIFIPIISQTYCDSRSFAWQHEFCAFNKLAKEDHFGRDVKLNNGNVTSRILSIKIHDLDPQDNALLEKELGGVLRSIQFIYSSPGVNRPLTPSDNPEKNLNKTLYRDQINKVANAIKEIIGALTNVDPHRASRFSNAGLPSYKTTASLTEPRAKRILAFASLAILIALLAGYFIFNFTTFGKEFHPAPLDKSIAVLPFVNMSNDKEQDYFSDGLTEEILNRLASLPNLKVIARTSSFAFKGKNLPIQKIADSLGVAYIVEGSVRRADTKLRVSVQLIRSGDGTQIWSKTYDQVLKDIFKIQEDIAENVAKALDIYLDNSKKEMMFSLGTRNVDAYESFLKGKAIFIQMHSPTGGSLWAANNFFEQALEFDSTFAAAYWYQHDAYMHSLLSGSGLLFSSDDEQVSAPEVYEKMNSLIDKAIFYTHDPSIQNMYRMVKTFYSDNWSNLPVFANKFANDPNAAKMMAYSETVLGTYSLILLGKGETLYQICSQAVIYDPLQPTIWQRGSYGALASGHLNEALEFITRGEVATGTTFGGRSILLALGREMEILNKNSNGRKEQFDVGDIDGFVAIAYNRAGQFDKAQSIADSLFQADSANTILVWAYDELRKPNKANKIAGGIDKMVLGSVRLSLLVTSTYNLDHLVFDASATPNFARRLKEAGIDLTVKNLQSDP